jgi:equilibrative nucleoside transporter 1/2/3
MMGLFAISNGYICNMCLMSAPKLVSNSEKEMASSILAAFLGLGLTCGSAISFALIQFVS